MRQRWVYHDDGTVDEVVRYSSDVHHVMTDIEPFRSPDGAVIMGRRQWREHLKATDSIEMNHADMKVSQENWNKRQQAFQDRLKGAAKHVQEVQPPAGRNEFTPHQMSRLNVEMANRLHNRPPPERKQLIAMTLEQAKRMKHGR